MLLSCISLEVDHAVALGTKSGEGFRPVSPHAFSAAMAGRGNRQGEGPGLARERRMDRVRSMPSNHKENATIAPAPWQGSSSSRLIRAEAVAVGRICGTADETGRASEHAAMVREGVEAGFCRGKLPMSRWRHASERQFRHPHLQSTTC